jgi:type VI protein secretion system component VasK
MMVGPTSREWPGKGSSPAPPKRLSPLSRNEVERQAERLAYLCRLLSRARRPFCPINGLLTVLPYKLLAYDSSEGAQIKEAVRADVTETVANLKLRFPVTVLITGMEQDRGFGELVQRVGKGPAESQRFGKGFGVWDPPLPEEIGALCKNACWAFEQWVYSEFRKKDSLTKPGNRPLYSLLCKVRREIEPRLDRVLVDGLAVDSESEAPDEAPLFSGCYFAATGQTEEQQAFTKSVLRRFFLNDRDEKPPGLQEELAWTRAAEREEQRYRTIATIALLLDVLFVVAIGVMIWWLNRGTPQ